MSNDHDDQIKNIQSILGDRKETTEEEKGNDKILISSKSHHSVKKALQERKWKLQKYVEFSGHLDSDYLFSLSKEDQDYFINFIFEHYGSRRTKALGKICVKCKFVTKKNKIKKCPICLVKPSEQVWEHILPKDIKDLAKTTKERLDNQGRNQRMRDDLLTADEGELRKHLEAHLDTSFNREDYSYTELKEILLKKYISENEISFEEEQEIDEDNYEQLGDMLFNYEGEDHE